MDNLQTLSHTSLPEPFESSDLTIEGAPKYDTDIIILREKVIVCGDEMTGKTTLIQALLARRTTSNGDYRMTQGLEMNVATISLERDREGDNNDANVQEVDLFLYDLGGGEHSDSIFLKMTNSSIGQVVTKHCTCIIYVFDVCCRKSLQSVMRWMDILDKSLDNDRQNVPMILVGNKADLRYGKDTLDFVSAEEGIQFAKDYGCVKYFECSCSSGSFGEVEAPFRFIANQSASL